MPARGVFLYLLNRLLTDRHEAILQGSSVDVQDGDADARWQLFQACSPLRLPHQVAAQLLKAPAETNNACHSHKRKSIVRVPAGGVTMLAWWGAYPMISPLHGSPDLQSACSITGAGRYILSHSPSGQTGLQTASHKCMQGCAAKMRPA